MRRLDKMRDNINVDTITDLIFKLYKHVDSTFMYSFLSSGELELLVRKLPPEVTQAHAKKDDFKMEQLLSLLPGKHTENSIKIFSAALRAIFCTMSHRQEIGEEVLYETIRIMLRGVVAQFFEGETL